MRPIYPVFRVNDGRNATETLRDYADILRTPSDVRRRLTLVVGMVVTVDAEQCLDASREKSRRLPRVGAGLHQPRRCGGLQGVVRNALDARPLARGGKAFLDVSNAFTVFV